MSITKPYTFQPNTKARANEVNANFDTLYSQANTNISNIEANARDIDELNDTKAELNGDSTQRFAVADPVNDTDAINRQTMLGKLSPTIDYIGGLTIAKDSSSPNDTIIVSSGSCYDSTKKIVLSLVNSISKKNATQAASTTYYVHIVGNSTGSSTDIIISPDSIDPKLPSGYTLYRLIGYYTTNGNGNINLIYNYSNSLGVKEIAGGVLPDWSRAISLGLDYHGNLPYTFKRRGWFVCGLSSRNDRQHGTLRINGIVITSWGNDLREGWNHGGGAQVMVSVGDVLTSVGTTFNFEGAYLVPFKGDV